MPDALSGYALSRLIFERSLALIYLIAFVCAANQFVPLLGERGLLPVPRFVRAVPFRKAPSLFFLAPTDVALRPAASIGIVLSAVALTGFVDAGGALARAGVWAALWLLYLSFVNVGWMFYAFGWEKLLLRNGVLNIILW